MSRALRVALTLALALGAAIYARAATKAVAVLWETAGAAGDVRVDRGTIETLAGQRPRLELLVAETPNAEGLPTLVTVATAPRGFTFRLGDVDAAYPIFLPTDHVVVTESSDRRTYAEIVAAIRGRKTTTKLQRIAAAPETSFATAAADSRDPKLQTWLGISRDIRMFRVAETLESFQPRFAGYDVPLAETLNQPATYAFQFGRGWGARDTVRRHLDDNTLPILQGQIDDDAIRYDVTVFASLEKPPLTAEDIRGTDYLVADRYGHGHAFTPAQAAAEQERHETEMNAPEEVVLYVRAVATNRGATPTYAFLKTATPVPATPTSPKLPAWSFDPVHGFGAFASGRVFAVGKIDGKPLRAEEVSVLLRPGASTTLEFFVPHRPISRERALALARQSFEARLAEARTFWRGKLQAAAQVRLPEPRIEQMVRAGLLHLDLVTYGRESAGPLLPAIGVYTAIGSESAPIIQFMDAMGRHETAARALDFFLAKQHDDGFMQNFNGYMLETGAVLWTLGEHYRYTRDEAWLRRVHPNITKACAYLQAWRQRNLSETAGEGRGLLDGKTADPEDPYRSFMLNGYAYLGFARAAEMLRGIAPGEAARWAAEADALKADIRRALASALERSPVVPLGDGTWSRAAPPWTGYRGPVALHADGGNWFTHGAMVSRDSLLGPLYLVFQEVVAPGEPMATELLETHAELMTRDNIAFSQPYYSRHPWVHLQRGEPKPFLAAWYGTLAALADRETYTFNEHFFPVSAHKTHEEAWFLMETRWMLYLEAGDTLRLFAGAPRAWFAPGATIAVQKAASYFGPLSFAAVVAADGKSVRVTVEADASRAPRTVEIRVPHSSGQRARSVTGAVYQAETETVRLERFAGRAEVELRY